MEALGFCGLGAQGEQVCSSREARLIWQQGQCVLMITVKRKTTSQRKKRSLISETEILVNDSKNDFISQERMVRFNKWINFSSKCGKIKKGYYWMFLSRYNLSPTENISFCLIGWQKLQRIASVAEMLTSIVRCMLVCPAAPQTES